MNVTIRKIGNSEGVIIPKEVLDRFGLKAGDILELQAEDGRFYMQPVDEDISEELNAARLFMEKYKVALKKLAE
ncbi:putative addiction module antidote [Rhizobium sp. BK529]|uniref:AbrB/MazE/SpoVT family DNA-binding domain-containing protein n=1 Tax=unclassified Rhizobium TaxID=2613769 RepID=UPI00104FF490|nr:MULTISPECIES: AbrB/MazE/SpoVT family DNA-binding domain-containing protein [unclassified Rhizobium]MBB3389791.1 putative addiction module antidote [Rhizobium sp. BK275]MBB3411424.1 putative addiction module antidote [Rhizobium sp. BK316]MBB3591789.1 putative addiction module antidote [Rhizobium sp. BK529]TCS08326.1 putative addiction module antidote [Rhizobium sp. BK418]